MTPPPPRFSLEGFQQAVYFFMASAEGQRCGLVCRCAQHLHLELPLLLLQVCTGHILVETLPNSGLSIQLRVRSQAYSQAEYGET